MADWPDPKYRARRWNVGHTVLYAAGLPMRVAAVRWDGHNWHAMLVQQGRRHDGSTVEAWMYSWSLDALVEHGVST